MVAPMMPVRLLRVLVAAVVPPPAMSMMPVVVMRVVMRVAVRRRLGRVAFRHFDRRRRLQFGRIRTARLESLHMQRPVPEASIIKVQDRLFGGSGVRKSNSPAASRPTGIVPPDLHLLDRPNSGHKFQKVPLRH
jgi:hypothetical protein